jgi:Tfp pilus assembly protein PilN
MKISTNFATPAGRMMPYLAGIFLLLSTVAVIVSFALFISARQISAEVPELEERLARYRSREIQQPTDLLSHDKLVELRSRVQKLNELTSTTGQTLPLLFSRLEKLIPDGVWLVTLQYQSRENETKLVAEAHYAEQLTEFMGQLERSGLFSQVLLTRQTQRAEDANAIQFEIQLRGKQ